MSSEPLPGLPPPGKTYALQLYLGDKLLGVYPVGPSGLQVGSQSGSDIVVVDSSASRKHCRVFLEKGDCKVVDLKSPHGTIVNGKTVRAATLQHGDILEFGSLRLKVVAEETSALPGTGTAGVHRPAVTHMEVASAEKVVGNRAARLGLAAYWLLRRHPLWSLFVTAAGLPFLVVGLATFDPAILQTGALDNEYGRWFGAWMTRRDTGLALAGKLKEKKAEEEEDAARERKGRPDDAPSAGGPEPKTLEMPPKPRLKLIEGIGSAMDQLGGQTSAMLVKPMSLGGKSGPAECIRGRRPDIPCLARSKTDDGRERILIKWRPGAFHKDSWKKLPDEVIRALRNSSPYPEGYIDPEEELFPKPPPTVLGTDEANAMFHAITGLDPQGDVRAGTNPWDQLLKDEKHAQAAMNCPTCPIAARVQSDRGVYYGEKIK